MTYDVTLLDAQLRATGCNIAGCSSTGRIDWATPPTVVELALAEQVKAAHDPDAMKKEEQAEKKALKEALADLDGVDQVKWRAAVSKILRALVRHAMHIE